MYQLAGSAHGDLIQCYGGNRFWKTLTYFIIELPGLHLAIIHSQISVST